ncbi:GntR family transcriptional regulator [bacterium]|nr:GntR family transcriptional regulator [bacterium]
MLKKTSSRDRSSVHLKVTIDKTDPTPIYYQIVKSISEEISKNRVLNNTSLPSERFIAEQLGVNRGTIRKAYSRLVSGGIIRREGKRRIFISPGKKTITSNIIGLVLPMDLSFYVQNKAWITFDYISGVMDASKESNCSVNLIAFPSLSKNKESVKEWFENIKATNLGGLVYLGPRTHEKDPALDMLMTLEIPRVFVSGHCTEENFGAVRGDEKVGMQAGVEHLIELGHKRIGVIGLANGGAHSSIFRHDAYCRTESFVSVLKKNGIEIDNKLILKCKNAEGEIKRGVKRFLGYKNRPTAVMCFNDEVAVSVMRESQKMGLNIPDDLSVIGFDDSTQASESMPRLTTIRRPRRIIGKEALKFVLKWIKNGECPSPSVRFLPTSLVIRESTGLLKGVRNGIGY